jgi:hypothetical protein
MNEFKKMKSKKMVSEKIKEIGDTPYSKVF